MVEETRLGIPVFTVTESLHGSVHEMCIRDRVWTGIEYKVASHLMFEGEVEKGLDIVRTCRDRYDGRVRNPFNEYENEFFYGRDSS